MVKLNFLQRLDVIVMKILMHIICAPKAGYATG